jgi:muconolactone D-isomerase
MEFLVAIDLARLPADVGEDLLAAERVRGRELQAARTIERIWRVPGKKANVGIWRAADATELHAAIESLPAFPWMSVTVTPLAAHPLEANGENDA